MTGDNEARKLYLYSSHDSMVVPLLLSLGNYQWQWPPYAASITFELWRHRRSGDHYVKLTYNDQVSAVMSQRGFSLERLA